MKKYLGILLLNILVLAAFFVWFDQRMPKIAVVNLQKIVSKADKVQNLRVEHNKKLDELELWLNNSEQEILKTSDEKKREDLVRQYKDIAIQKENLIKDEYNKRLQEIEQEIAETIDVVALKNNCNVVLYKNSVSMGGLDITNEILQSL